MGSRHSASSDKRGDDRIVWDGNEPGLRQLMGHHLAFSLDWNTHTVNLGSTAQKAAAGFISHFCCLCLETCCKLKGINAIVKETLRGGDGTAKKYSIDYLEHEQSNIEL